MSDSNCMGDSFIVLVALSFGMWSHPLLPFPSLPLPSLSTYSRRVAVTFHICVSDDKLAATVALVAQHCTTLTSLLTHLPPQVAAVCPPQLMGYFALFTNMPSTRIEAVDDDD